MKSGIMYFNIFLFQILFVFPVSAQHFQKVWEYNPWQPMNIIVNYAFLDEIELLAGDEIAVFDIETGSGDEICVGVVVLTSNQGPFVIISSTDDPATPYVQDGFIAGHPIIYRYWDASGLVEITLIKSTYDPSLDDMYVSLGTALVTLEGSSFISWTGLTDNNWANIENWSFPKIPDQTVQVIIPSSPIGGNFPHIFSINAKCRDLELKPGASLLISSHLEIGE